MKTRQCFNKFFTALWLCVILSAIPVMSFSQQEYFYTYDGKKYISISQPTGLLFNRLNLSMRKKSTIGFKCNFLAPN